VVDDSNDQLMLLSNRLGPGERDQNPLSRAILREPPSGIDRPLDIVYQDTIQIIGVSMPARVDRGDTFSMTFYYKILKPVGRNWKVFVHFDHGSDRFQGDHTPIRNRCGTSFFQAGDYVVDTFEVKAGSLAEGTPKAAYRIYAGFFVGASGNYTNMKVTKGEADDNNRVTVGTITLK
jgi:hypothetical protein